MGELLDDSAATIGLSPVWLSHLVQPLVEDLPPTASVLTTPSTDPYLHPDCYSQDGQIRQSTHIAAVPGFRQHAAIRAGSCFQSRGLHKPPLSGLHDIAGSQ